MKDQAPDILDAAIAAFGALDDWSAEPLKVAAREQSAWSAG